jgi:hypothetical protein
MVAGEDCEVNEYDARIVQVQGEFSWHRHADLSAPE